MIEIKTWLEIYDEDVIVEFNDLNAVFDIINSIYGKSNYGLMDGDGKPISKTDIATARVGNCGKLLTGMDEIGNRFGIVSILLKSEEIAGKHCAADPHVATITIREVSKDFPNSFTITGHEVIEKTVVPWGNGGGVHVPAEWIGEPVKIVRIYPVKN